MQNYFLTGIVFAARPKIFIFCMFNQKKSSSCFTKQTIFLVVLFLHVCCCNKAGAQQFNGKYYFPQVYFDSADAVNRLAEGNSTISGVSFAREGSFINGKVHNAFNQTVLLFPFTAYFAEWYNLKYDNPKSNIIMVPQAFAQRLETKTDAYGNFSFKKMKPGKYYLECSINYSGTAVGTERVGTGAYYYGWSSYSYPIYQSYYYNYNAVQKANKVVEVKRDGQLIEVKLRPNPFESFRSGKPTSTDCYLVNNKQYGDCKEFYASGGLKVFASWKDGLMDGPSDYYYENGTTQASGKYKKGFKVGNWKYFDSSAVITAEENFVYRDKMGVKEGAFKYYHKSGKIRSVYNYEDDKPAGDSYDYFESGKVKAKYFYKDGAAEGAAMEYYESGKIKATLNYKNNKLDGTCIFYTERGTVEKTTLYKNGQVQSEKLQ